MKRNCWWRPCARSAANCLGIFIDKFPFAFQATSFGLDPNLSSRPAHFPIPQLTHTMGHTRWLTKLQNRWSRFALLWFLVAFSQLAPRVLTFDLSIDSGRKAAQSNHHGIFWNSRRWVVARGATFYRPKWTSINFPYFDKTRPNKRPDRIELERFWIERFNNYRTVYRHITFDWIQVIYFQFSSYPCHRGLWFAFVRTSFWLSATVTWHLTCSPTLSRLSTRSDISGYSWSDQRAR